MKHSWPLIHNHVPVFVYNGMIGSVLVLRCWFLILLSIEVQYTLNDLNLTPTNCVYSNRTQDNSFVLPEKGIIN